MRCAKQNCPHLENQRDYAADPLTGLCSGCLYTHIINCLEDVSAQHEELAELCDAFERAGVEALDDVILRENRKSKKAVCA